MVLVETSLPITCKQFQPQPAPQPSQLSQPHSNITATSTHDQQTETPFVGLGSIQNDDLASTEPEDIIDIL